MNLKDLFEVDTLLENFENIRSPEDLQYTIQSAQDVFSRYGSYLKKIPADLSRWETTLKNLNLLSENTDVISEAKDMIFRQTYNLTKGTILEGKLGLEDILKSNQEESLYYSLGNIKLDFVYDVKPVYQTRAESRPIISRQNIDRLNEHAENENPTFSMQVGLKGDDADRRFTQILALRDNKQIVKIVTEKVFEKCLITRISLTYSNAKDIVFDITFQNVFIAQLKRTANRLVISTNKEPVIDNVEPIPSEQVPADEDIQESLSATKSLGIVTPITYQGYNVASAPTIGYGGRSF